MRQPPDDQNSMPTEQANFQEQWPRRPGQMPQGRPPQASPPNFAPTQPSFPLPPQGGPNNAPRQAPQGGPQQPSSPNFAPGQGGRVYPGQNYPPANAGPGPYFPGPLPSWTGQEAPSRPGFPPQGPFAPQRGPANQPGPFAQGYGPGPSQQGSGVWQGAFPPPQEPPGQPGPFASPSSRPGQPPQFQNSAEVPSAWLDTKQPPRSGKKGRTHWKAIVSILIVLVLTIGGVGIYLVSNGKHSISSVTTPTSTTRATPTARNVTPFATLPANSNAPTAIGILGKPVTAGNTWIATVTKVQTNSTSAIPPKAGDTYLEINLTLKNVSTAPVVLSSLFEFALRGSDGQTYQEALSDTNNTHPPDGTLAVGQTINAVLSYQVPQSLHQFILIFKYGLIEGNTAFVTWSLAT